MGRIYLDLIPLYILLAVSARLFLRRSPAVVGGRQLALWAALAMLAMWLPAIDALFTSGSWAGPGWVVLAAGVGVGVPLVTLGAIGKLIRGWAVLKVSLPQALAAIEKAAQGVRFSYDMKPPTVILRNPDGTLTVRHIPLGFLWISFGGNLNQPKLRLLKKVVYKFIVYGVPGG